jgi:hypothetical protein
VSEERRQAQRIRLPQPIDGWFGDFAVRLLDLSAVGALLDHNEEIPDDSRALLRFFWHGAAIEVTAEIVRRHDHRQALRFIEECTSLSRMLDRSTREIELAQEANARGDREENIIDGDQTLTAASAGRMLAGYTVWRLTDGGWKGRPALLPDQPEDGFTISADESDDQVELLCRTYETGDGESRRLTRLLAEMSVSQLE